MIPPLQTMSSRSKCGDDKGPEAELQDCLAALHAVVDITGNSAIEGALVAASLYARSLLEASLDPLVTISPEGKITDLNEATEQVTGLAREALIGTDFSDYFTEPARARTAYVQVFKGGQVRDYPLAIRHTAGSTTDVLYNASLYRDERGKVVGVFAAARDVTHLKRAQRELETRETALRESEERLALALEATNDGMWDFNVATGDAVFSPRYYTLLGYLPYEFPQTYDAWKNLVHPDDIGAAEAEINAHPVGGDGYAVEFRMRAKNGDWRQILSRGKVVDRHDDGRPIRMVGTHTDVTELRRAERAAEAGAEQLRQTLKGTVAAFGATTEMRDPYTAGHQRRVAELACAIATDLGWDEDRIERLRTAALLHDIGKIVVPAEILSKPGRLTETEMMLVREHAAAGADAIAASNFEGSIAEAIRQHHERLDGSGYPAGLHGDEILPEARILAVADVVEAMVSHRPYRPALSIAEAPAEVEDGAGSRYDADVCAACLNVCSGSGFKFGE